MPAAEGQKHRERLPVHHKTNRNTFTPKCNLASNSPDLHVFGLWEKTGVYSEKYANTTQGGPAATRLGTEARTFLLQEHCPLHHHTTYYYTKKDGYITEINITFKVLFFC